MKVVPQTVFFIPPRKIHFFNPSPRILVEAFTLRFQIVLDLGKDIKEIERDKEMMELVKLLYAKKPKYTTLGLKEAEEARIFLQKIIEQSNLKKFGYLLTLKGHILLLLQLFLLAGVEEEKDVEPHSRTQTVFLRATSFIYRNVNKPIQLKEVAKFCYISPNYLQKIFKQFLGRSFTTYIHETKIDYAKFLLRTTDLSIDEIAEKCGIYDSNYFSRLFKRTDFHNCAKHFHLCSNYYPSISDKIC